MKKSLFIGFILLMSVFAPMLMIPVKGQDVEVTFFAGSQTTDAVTTLVDEFNADVADGYKIVFQEGQWNTEAQLSEYQTKFRAEDPSIDIISMDVIWPSTFNAEGWLTPLPFMDDAKDDFIEAPVLAGTGADGKIYGAPWFHDSGMLYYRLDILSYAVDQGLLLEGGDGAAITTVRAPETWNELLEWGKAMLGDTGLVNTFETFANGTDAGIDLVGHVWQGNQYEGFMCDFMEILGGTEQTSWIEGSGTDATANFDTQNVKDAIGFMKDLVDDGVSPAAVFTYGEEESRAVWNSAGAIFHRNWPYAYRLGLDITAINGSTSYWDGYTDDGILWSVDQMPYQDGKNAANVRTSCLGGWQLGVSAFSEHKDEAIEFVEWMTGADQQVTMFLEAGNTPTRLALYEDSRITTSTQGYVSAFLPAFKAALPRPVHELYPSMSEVVWSPLQKGVKGDLTIDAAVAELNKVVQEVLDSSTFTQSPFLWMYAILAFAIVPILKRKRKRF